MKKDGRLMTSFSDIIDQIKIAILTTGVVDRPALFCGLIDGVGGCGRGIAFLIHRGRG